MCVSVCMCVLCVYVCVCVSMYEYVNVYVGNEGLYLSVVSEYECVSLSTVRLLWTPFYPLCGQFWFSL